MSDDALWVDGNALAGLLADVLGADATTTRRRCPGCGARNAVGAHRAYRGAGAVLRCPACGRVAARIAIVEDRLVVHLTGAWELHVPRP